MVSYSDCAIFIQSNQKQLLGAKVAKYALEVRGHARTHGVPVSIIQVESLPEFRNFLGKPYRKHYAPFSFTDLQSFTLTRFLPPTVMHFRGRALVIDPDIFALTDIAPLIRMNLDGAAIAACRKNPWDTSVMVLDCKSLKHWDVPQMLDDIATGNRTYEDIMALRSESARITELSREWNSLDRLDERTGMLHTTNRLTQPWRTGLNIDFTFNPPPRLFGFIPRFWVRRPTQYLPHPDTHIEACVIQLFREAHESGAVTDGDIDSAIKNQEVRGDFLELMRNTTSQGR